MENFLELRLFLFPSTVFREVRLILCVTGMKGTDMLANEFGDQLHANSFSICHRRHMSGGRKVFVKELSRMPTRNNNPSFVEWADVLRRQHALDPNGFDSNQIIVRGLSGITVIYISTQDSQNH